MKMRQNNRVGRSEYLKNIVVGAVATLSLSAETALGAAIFFGPIPYLSAADSPFFAGIQAGTITLEDFEDGLLNVPLVVEAPATRAGVATSFSAFPIHSVDADDGIIDGFGNAGDAWVPSSSGEYVFQLDAGGNLPRYVGLVITETALSILAVGFEAFDQNGNLLGLAQMSFADGNFVTDNGTNGRTVADRFVGVFNEEGISRIEVGGAIQIDHLQFGSAIPEPNSALLTLCAGGLWLMRRRRI